MMRHLRKTLTPTPDDELAKNVRKAAQAYNDAVGKATSAGLIVSAFVRRTDWISCHPEFISDKIFVMSKFTIERQRPSEKF